MERAPSSPVLTTGAKLCSGFGFCGNRDEKGVLLEVPHGWTGVVQLYGYNIRWVWISILVPAGKYG